MPRVQSAPPRVVLEDPIRVIEPPVVVGSNLDIMFNTAKYQDEEVTEAERQTTTAAHRLRFEREGYILTLARDLEHLFNLTLEYGRVIDAERDSTTPYEPQNEVNLKLLQRKLLDKVRNLVDLRIPQK